MASPNIDSSPCASAIPTLLLLLEILLSCYSSSPPALAIALAPESATISESASVHASVSAFVIYSAFALALTSGKLRSDTWHSILDMRISFVHSFVLLRPSHSGYPP